MDLYQLRQPAPGLVRLHESDNVAVAMRALRAGEATEFGTLQADIPAGHKVACRAIAAGEELRRYGQVIGRASAAIAPAAHVHTHNLAFEDGAREYLFPTTDSAPAVVVGPPVWQGYLRADGRAGTRNYLAVVAASNCSAHVAELVAESYRHQALPEGVDGVVAFSHGDGCGHAIGPDTVQLRRTLEGVIAHPNVAGALLIGLGCEVNQIDPYLSPSLQGLTLQNSGGTSATVEEARRLLQALIEGAAAQPRVPLPASKLCLGLNCGGSDSFSGITANPALGRASDLLVAQGGTSVLAETPEIVGAEHLLVRRARNRATAERLLAMIASYQRYLDRFQSSFDDNPSPGNKAGGLSNILEKALGAVAKAGQSPLNEVVDYAEPIHGPGLCFMNTPGYDPVSLAGLAAGGANLIAFTTGRGSAIGFPTVPVIKISTNSSTYSRMRDNMDINAGLISDGAASLDDLGSEIFDFLLRAASGVRTRSEVLGHREFVPWRIGPVM